MDGFISNYKTEVSRVPIAKGNRRVYITLSKDAVDKLEKMAEREMRSLSSMTALMVMRGLEVTEKDVKQKENEGGKWIRKKATFSDDLFFVN
jgi:hypothetical protein